MAAPASEENSVSVNSDSEQTFSSNENSDDSVEVPSTTFKTSFICSECSGLFATLPHLELHTLTHSRKSVFVCPKSQCNEEFSNDSDFISHFEAHSAGNITGLLYCQKCNAGFSSDEQLTAHRRSHTPHVCSECGNRFTRAHQLSLHLRTHTGERPFSCTDCGRRFARMQCVRRHKRARRKCALARLQRDAKFARENHLLGNVEVKQPGDGEPNVCPECGRCFLEKSSFLSHVKSHLVAKEYVCHLCSVRYSCSSSLTAHLRKHYGEKPFVCDRCPARCNTAVNLKVHLRVHGAGKPLACTECDASFSSLTMITRHRQLHAKPFACLKCNARFTEKRYLDTHMRQKRYDFQHQPQSLQ